MYINPRFTLSLKQRFPTFYYRTCSFCCLPIFFIRRLKTIEKQINILSSWETILDCQTWLLACYPLGHWKTSKLVNLKHILNIKPLWWKPADTSFHWTITTSKISRFLLQRYIIESYNFHPTSAFDYEFHTLSHPTIFLTARRWSKECLHPSGHARKSSTHPLHSLD